MRHVIVIETVGESIPAYLPDRFQADVIATLDRMVRKYKGESFIQTKFYVESAIAAIHEMFNAPKWDPNAPIEKPKSTPEWTMGHSGDE